MIPLPRDIDAPDIHQWLVGGVCVYNAIPMSYNEAGEDGVYLSTMSGVTERVPHSRKHNIFAHWPACGSLTINRHIAVYLRRSQQQQYRRTYNHRCLDVIVPGKWKAMRAAGTSVGTYHPQTPSVIEAAFDPIYPEFDEVLRQLEQPTCYSVALSPHIILAGNEREQEVFYKGRRCGVIRNGTYSSTGMIVAASRIFKLLSGRVTV